ncbi:hypothetical protein WR25_04291 [Diploscapter pachys]|uniref:Uncharacterized protein n=1 Tax=Diploscapter pachys TaxID=2018661 RepID=A0A2A2JXN9_9BILA|nr:hypothetical protein WR25_04291 [Diploscapter pachys]
MRSETYELQHGVIWLAINQHQVGLDVAVPVIFPVTGERVIVVLLGQYPVVRQGCDYSNKIARQCLAVSAIKSSTVANDFKPPRRASFIASIVVVFGTNGSKGKAFSRATRVNMIRKASDTVSPIAASTTVASSFICSSMRARTTAFADMI